MDSEKTWSLIFDEGSILILEEAILTVGKALITDWPLEISVLNLSPGGFIEGKEKVTLISLNVRFELGF